MKYFAVRRLAFSLLLVFVASLVIFFGMRAAPGDVTSQLVNPANSYSTYLIPNLKKILGLDKPLGDQYLDFIGNTLSGHPGVSLDQRRPDHEDHRQRRQVHAPSRRHRVPADAC